MSSFGPGGMKIPGMGPGSPRIGGGLGLGGQGGPGNVGSTGGLGLGAGIMGPPGLPRTASGDAMNMNIMGNANPNAGINMNMINGQQRQSPRPQSSMGMSADISSQLGLPPTGPQQQQRQGSVPPQFSNSQQHQQHQQQMRQGSLPPGTGPGQQLQRQKMGQDGMNMNLGGGSMGMSMGGGMGMGMKSNNDMRASTSTTPMNMGMAGMNSMGNMGSIGNMGGMNSGMNNMGGMNPMNMTMNIIPPAPHSTSSNSSAPTPASPLLGGGGLGPQGLVPSLSASSIGSNTGGQPTIPSTIPSMIQQTTSLGPASISSTSASISGPTTIGDAPGTSSTPGIASTSTAATVGVPSNASSLPPLPPHVKPSTTQITTFPLATAHLHIPVLTSPEISQIQGWMKKDQEYEVILGKTREKMVEEVREALGTGSSGGGVGGIGGTAAPGWWEMPGTGNFNRWRRRGEMFEVRYPRTKRERDREREREGRGKKTVRREGLKLFVSFFLFFSFFM